MVTTVWILTELYLSTHVNEVGFRGSTAQHLTKGISASAIERGKFFNRGDFTI